MRVATLCGSHQPGSTNAAVLSVVAGGLRDRGAEVIEIDVDADVPAFRPDQVDEAPRRVRSLRAAVEEADGIAIAVPEYAGGAPGWVKNITDWMVGSASLYERPAAVVSAATAGGHNAIEQIVRTLSWQGARVVATYGVAAPRTKIDTGNDAGPRVTDDGTVRELDRVADALVAAINGGESRAIELAFDIRESLGIPSTPGGG